jgi:hypothetical protein
VAATLVLVVGAIGALIATAYAAAVLLYVLSRSRDWTPQVNRRGLVALSGIGTVTGAFALGTVLWLLLLRRS